MVKLILSPLFISLVILVLTHIVLLRQWRKLSLVPKISLKAGLVVTIGLLILSMPVVADSLVYLMESPFVGTESQIPDKVSAIVVLDGGSIQERRHEENHLCEESLIRVFKGVRLFKTKKSKWLVLSGGSHGDSADIDGQLMKKLAIELGVPADKIILECNSMNTMEHPKELIKFSDTNMDEPLVIVTSGWHLRRAIREFRRYYKKPLPVPSSLCRGPRFNNLAEYIPNVNSLMLSTTIAHEQIGLMWYSLKQLWPSN